MIRILSFIVVAALAVFGAVWFAERPGRVRLVWQGWEVETSVAIAALAVVLVAIAAALLYRMWRALRRAPAAYGAHRRHVRRERGYKALTQGMVAVAAGDADEARKHARRADALLGEPPLTMLLSAQAAQLGGDEAAATQYFTAMLGRQETAFLGLRGLLMQARRNGDRPRALELARQAYTQRPKTPWVLVTLFDLQVEAGRWREALATLEEAIRRNAVERTEGRRRMAVVLLGCSREAEEAGDRAAALDYAKRATTQNPDFLPATIRLIALMVAAGRKRPAARILNNAWSREPHPELARLYAAMEDSDDPIKVVRRFEKLLSFNPDHAESHIALAESLLAARLWGAARTHLGKAAGDAPTARVCRLMAELEEGEKGDMAAVRRWLLAAARAEPDPAWTCSACGAQAADWAPTCPKCRALGTLEWRTPVRARGLVFRPLAAGAGDAAADETVADGTGAAPALGSATGTAAAADGPGNGPRGNGNGPRGNGNGNGGLDIPGTGRR